MSDHGQSYFELCKSFGRLPHEFRDAPAPARYFAVEAHNARQQRVEQELAHHTND